jgi:hypothetical protein
MDLRTWWTTTNAAREASQAQQALAESRHGARVVFILIVGGIERVQDNDLRDGCLRRREEVLHPLRCAEQMAGGACIDEQVLIRSVAHCSAHDREAADKLWDRQLELTDQHAAQGRHRKAHPVGARRQRQREVGDQQRFADFRFTAYEESALCGQQSRLHQAGRRGRLLLQQLRQ